ncbi:MAG TPA: invasion associated locus B family protein [Xanthobacteraceae bacterium]|jgi:invasion protein IalB
MLMIRALDIGSPAVRVFDRRPWAAGLRLTLAAGLVVSGLVGSGLEVSPAARAQTPPPAPAPAKPAPKPPPAAAAPAPASAPAGDAQPTLLGQYGDWGAYWAAPNGRKVCFTIAKPKSSQTNPAGRKRDQAYVFISTRPAENVRNEVSVIIGYPFKPSTDATAEIGADKFAMYTLNDGAWIKNVAEEARMVDAMRKGSDLTVKGVSGHGTESTDQYSLKGLSQAVDRAGQECK